MDKDKPANPHAIESHSQAHKEAFDALVDRIAKAVRRQRQHEGMKKPFASKTHTAYPAFGPRRKR